MPWRQSKRPRVLSGRLSVSGRMAAPEPSAAEYAAPGSLFDLLLAAGAEDLGHVMAGTGQVPDDAFVHGMRAGLRAGTPGADFRGLGAGAAEEVGDVLRMEQAAPGGVSSAWRRMMAGRAIRIHDAGDAPWRAGRVLGLLVAAERRDLESRASTGPLARWRARLKDAGGDPARAVRADPEAALPALGILVGEAFSAGLARAVPMDRACVRAHLDAVRCTPDIPRPLAVCLAGMARIHAVGARGGLDDVSARAFFHTLLHAGEALRLAPPLASASREDADPAWRTGVIAAQMVFPQPGTRTEQQDDRSRVSR